VRHQRPGIRWGITRTWHASSIAGTNVHVYELSIDPNLNQWITFDLTSATGAPSAAGDPTGYEHGTARVVSRDLNGHILELSVDPTSGWIAVDLTALSGAPRGGDPYGFGAQSAHVVVQVGIGLYYDLTIEPASAQWLANELPSLCDARPFLCIF